ncbi:hypothetical protein MTR_2g082490 [Medicago truncatula]|uniref:Uncharacterized protein n=1 Tax=Medicago truncatula TaxID=3880 RepID=G7IHC6_MEDTR|nr:hypothetical protein MTR_2g082490 [Medicago truncatula]
MSCGLKLSNLNIGVVQILCLQSEVIDLVRSFDRESAKDGQIKMSFGEQAKQDWLMTCAGSAIWNLRHSFMCSQIGQAMQIWRYFRQADIDPLTCVWCNRNELVFKAITPNQGNTIFQVYYLVVDLERANEEKFVTVMSDKVVIC